MNAKKVNLDDYYTAKEARDRLSENSGREIGIDYPRTLANKNKIRSLDIGARGKLYLKVDVDTYIVSTKRGRRPKNEAA